MATAESTGQRVLATRVPNTPRSATWLNNAAQVQLLEHVGLFRFCEMATHWPSPDPMNIWQFVKNYDPVHRMSIVGGQSVTLDTSNSSRIFGLPQDGLRVGDLAIDMDPAIAFYEGIAASEDETGFLLHKAHTLWCEWVAFMQRGFFGEFHEVLQEPDARAAVVAMSGVRVDWASHLTAAIARDVVQKPFHNVVYCMSATTIECMVRAARGLPLTDAGDAPRAATVTAEVFLTAKPEPQIQRVCRKGGSRAGTTGGGGP